MELKNPNDTISYRSLGDKYNLSDERIRQIVIAVDKFVKQELELQFKPSDLY